MPRISYAPVNMAYQKMHNLDVYRMLCFWRGGGGGGWGDFDYR